MPPYFDSHCHLEHSADQRPADDIIRDCVAAGVTRLLTVSVDRESCARMRALSERHPETVWHTVGVHPHETGAMQDSDLELIRGAAAHPACRAIGELGLDYFYQHSDRDTQIRRLEAQLELAVELGMPAVIHSRDAESDLLPILARFARYFPGGRSPGVIHCFTGTPEFGRACLDLGFYISFSGIVTFPKSEALRQCAREFPLERILIETDSPYLAPVPYRGKKCEPWMVRETAHRIAELRGLPPEELAAATFRNASELFRESQVGKRPPSSSEERH